MGNATTIIIGTLVLIIVILGGYSVMATREAAGNAQRIRDQEARIAGLQTEIRIKAQQIEHSEKSVRQFQTDHETLVRTHREETRKLEDTISGLVKTGKQAEAALKERTADADRLRSAIREQSDALRRMQRDRHSDRQKQLDLLATIDRLKEELSANERVIVELKNDREAIACLERAVPDVVLDRMLGGRVHASQSGQN